MVALVDEKGSTHTNMNWKLLLGEWLLRSARAILKKLPESAFLTTSLDRHQKLQPQRVSLSLQDVNDAAGLIEETISIYIASELAIAKLPSNVRATPIERLTTEIPLITLYELDVFTTTDALHRVMTDATDLFSSNSYSYKVVAAAMSPRTTNEKFIRFHSCYALLCQRLPEEYVSYFQMRFINIARQFNPSLTQQDVTDMLAQFPTLWMLPFIHSTWRRLLQVPT